MRPFVFVALYFVTSSVTAATPSGGREELQKLLGMPPLQLGFGVHYFANKGFILTGVSEDISKEIESLKSSMTGGPIDADRYYRLAQLYRDGSDYTKASNTLVRAIELYRKLSDTQPENAELLARFGSALSTAEKDGEAEVVLRRAVKIDPKDWRCWSALGRFFNVRFGASLFGGQSTNTRSFADVLAQASIKKIPGFRVEEAQKYLEEALACANRAVAVPLGNHSRMKTGRFAPAMPVSSAS